MLKATKGKLNTNSNVGLQLFWKRKYTSTIFYVQITSPKYCTKKSDTISDMCLIGSGPKFIPNKQINLILYGVCEPFKITHKPLLK